MCGSGIPVSDRLIMRSRPLRAAAEREQLCASRLTLHLSSLWPGWIFRQGSASSAFEAAPKCRRRWDSGAVLEDSSQPTLARLPDRIRASPLLAQSTHKEVLIPHSATVLVCREYFLTFLMYRKYCRSSSSVRRSDSYYVVGRAAGRLGRRLPESVRRNLGVEDTRSFSFEVQSSSYLLCGLIDGSGSIWTVHSRRE